MSNVCRGLLLFKLLPFCFCFGLFPTTSTGTVDGLSSRSPKIPTNVDQSFDPRDVDMASLSWLSHLPQNCTAVRCGACF